MAKLLSYLAANARCLNLTVHFFLLDKVKNGLHARIVAQYSSSHSTGLGLCYTISPDCFTSDQYDSTKVTISLGWLTVEIGVFRTSWLKMVTIIYCRAKFFPCLRILKIYGCFSRLVQIFANKWAWLSQWLTRYSLLWPLHFLFTQNIIHVKFDWKG